MQVFTEAVSVILQVQDQNPDQSVGGVPHTFHGKSHDNSVQKSFV